MSMEVNGSESYQIVRLAKFESTYSSLVKKHYRKNRQGLKLFEELIDDFIKDKLRVNPCSDSVSDRIPFPKGTAEQEFEFRKKRWQKLPKLQGAAKYGRL